MPLHVFGHIDPDHGVLVTEHGLCQRLAQFRLAHAGGAQEQETADGTLGVLQTHTATANGPGHGLYSLVLTHHTLMKDILHVQQALALVLCQTGHRDTGPTRHHSGDVLRVDVPVLLIILAALVTLDLHLLLVVLLDVPQLGGLLKVLGVDGGVLVLGQGVDLLLQALEFLGGFLLLHPHPAGGLVHQVDGLVGQEPVIDIPGGQLHGGLQCLVGDVQLVVLLILLPQALQDLQGSLLTGLAHRHRLEPAFQSGVLFDILAIFVQGGGADDLDLTAAQSGLDDIGGVHRALGGACAHDGVQLIDEEDDVAVLLNLLHHLLDTLLKFAPVLGAGHHAGKVQRQELLIQQVFRHIAHGDLPGQALGDGSLAHAGLTDQAGVVLGAAGQDLDDPLDLVITADDRVQLAGPGIRRQITGELCQCLAALAVLLGGTGCRSTAVAALGRSGRGGELLHQRGIELTGIHTGGPQNTDCHVVALPQNTGQQMLGADVGIAAPDGILHGDLHNVLGARGQTLSGIAAGKTGADAFPNHFRQQVVGQARLRQDGVGHALVLTHQAQQQVFRPHIAVTQFACGLLCQPQGFLRSGSKFIFIHNSIPLLFWGVRFV